MYIVFEGTVGTGKTTQSKLLVEWLQSQYPNKAVVRTREPGGSQIADDIRKIVQATPYTEQMDPVCEAYLYASSRAQTLRSVVKPVLDQGRIVVADRSFASSVAYQGVGLGLGYETIIQINQIAIGNILPDCVFYIDLDPAIGLSRTFDASGDKHETKSLEFFHQVRQGYQRLSKQDLMIGRWHSIDGANSISHIQDDIRQIIYYLMQKKWKL